MSEAVCIIPNCNNRAGASEPFCAKHADVRHYTMRQIIEMERCVEVMHEALHNIQRIGAFSEDHAYRLSGVTKSQLRNWARAGILRPSFAADDRRGPFSRIYSFRDIAALRVLNELRNVHGVRPKELKAVSEALSHWGDDRWTRTTLYAVKGHVVWTEPDTGDQYVNGIVLKIVVDDLNKAIRDLNRRSPEDYGRIERKKYVSHNAQVFAGTRIPVKVIQEFLKAGYDAAGIIKEYPTLTAADIAAAAASKYWTDLKTKLTDKEGFLNFPILSESCRCPGRTAKTACQKNSAPDDPSSPLRP